MLRLGGAGEGERGEEKEIKGPVTIMEELQENTRTFLGIKLFRFYITS